MDSKRSDGNGWAEWGRHVRLELERLDDCIEEQEKLIQSMRTEIALLKVKSGIYGGVSGAIPAIGSFLYTILKQMK